MVFMKYILYKYSKENEKRSKETRNECIYRIEGNNPD